ncbi:MAG: hypothetical protein ACI4KA_03435, partial [Oscillospiraceae bacterium]
DEGLSTDCGRSENSAHVFVILISEISSSPRRMINPLHCGNTAFIHPLNRKYAAVQKLLII